MSMLSRERRPGLVFALVWFAVLSESISADGKVPFLIVFPIVLSSAALLGLLAVVWCARCLSQRNIRPGQFGIATLLLATLYVAVFLSFVRGLTLHTQVPNSATGNAEFGYLSATVSCGIFVLLSILPTIYLVDAVLWSAVWLTRRRIRKNISDSNE